MKKAFLAISSIILFACCKENDTPIVFSHSYSTDSTYVQTSGLPSADAHNVLIEEFTGASCSNCPAAHTVLLGLEGTGHVNVVSLYITDFTQTTPPSGAHYDFRHLAASKIGSGIYGGIGAMPLGGVDRIPLAGSLLLGKSDWNSVVNAQKLLTDSVNLLVSSSFAGGVATITAKITYLQQMSTKQNLTIVIVEDSMVDIQEIVPGTAYPSGYDSTYTFTNVFRDMITSVPLGDPILDTMATKEKGRTFIRKYTYTPATMTPAIIPAHCRVIAFVNAPGGTGGDFHILQSWKTNLVP